MLTVALVNTSFPDISGLIMNERKMMRPDNKYPLIYKTL